MPLCFDDIKIPRWERLAEQAGTDFQRGIVFYTGESILPLGDENYLAMPLSKLWEL